MIQPQPVLSICIPNYNMGPWIGGAIRSALMQPASEVVVVDNVSTDDSLAVISAFTDPRLSVYEANEHVPLSDNFKRSVSLTTGEWCLVLCADDELTASFYDQFARGVEQHPEAVAISQAAIDPGVPAIVGDCLPTVYTNPVAVLRGPTLPVSSTAFLRRAYDEIGGFSPEAGWPADWDLWMRLVMQAGPVVALGVPGALYNRSRGCWATVAGSVREVESVRDWVAHRRGEWPLELMGAMDRSLAERSETVGRMLLAQGDRDGLELLQAAANSGSRTAARRLWIEQHPVLAKGYQFAPEGVKLAFRRLAARVR
jgi:glycosyltransferase involved in cell wall biosynthesis